MVCSGFRELIEIAGSDLGNGEGTSSMAAILRAADLFCGAGGTTTGAQMSGRVDVRLAVNHWRTAVQTHTANHAHVRHVCAEIDMVDPRDFLSMGIDVLLASPECVYHSNARGGKPVDDQRRATAWCVPRWAEVLRPKWIIVENVIEYENWAPLGSDNKPLKSKKGEIFQAWINTLRALNYHVEWRKLNSADFGGATKRVRLFIVARRGPSRQPIPWPAISHLKANWTPAASIIDWELPCPSIFGRKRPLAEKTIRRIEIGLRKFCVPGAEAFIVKLRNNETVGAVNDPLNTLTAGAGHYALAAPFQFKAMGRNPGVSKSILDPLPTIVATRENHAVVAPFFLPRQGHFDCRRDKPSKSLGEPLPVITASHGPGQLIMPFLVPQFGERDGQQPRTHSVADPLPAATSHGAGALVAPFISTFHNGDDGERRNYSIDEPLPVQDTQNRHSLVAPYFVDVNHGDGDRSPGGRVHSIEDPLGSLTTRHGKSLVFPFLTSYFANGKPQDVNSPLSTVTTKHRHGLAMVQLIQTMHELGIVDIGFRMLEPHELAAAQGFPAGYEIYGSKAEQVKQIGNSVHTLVAKALCTAIGEAA